MSQDGDGNDNNDPTVFVLPLAVTEISTVGEWGLILLAMLLGWVALRRVRVVGA